MSDFTFDPEFDFQSEVGKRDPDSHSATLQRYHQALWSKPLPSGELFLLAPVRVGAARALRYESERGLFILSSDTLANSNKNTLRSFYERMGVEANTAWHRYGGALGGRLVFPRNKVDSSQTINQRRGTHPRVRDRFDLTLEAIRRFYAAEVSPLTDVLSRYEDFFGLFATFDGYVRFFLLDDLVDDGSVKFYLPFLGFDRSPLPSTFDEYRRFREAQLTFVAARNERMRAALESAS